MALQPRITAAVANAMIGIIGSNVNNGFIKIYDGTQPTNGGDAITTQNLIATLPLNSTAFGAASNGVMAANAIGPAVAAFSSTAIWYRLTDSGGTFMIDGSVGTSGCDLNLNTVTITSGDTVAVTSFSITQPRS
jgi:hypothetical protein